MTAYAKRDELEEVSSQEENDYEPVAAAATSARPPLHRNVGFEDEDEDEDENEAARAPVQEENESEPAVGEKRCKACERMPRNGVTQWAHDYGASCKLVQSSNPSSVVNDSGISGMHPSGYRNKAAPACEWNKAAEDVDKETDQRGWCGNVAGWPLPGWRVTKTTRTRGVENGRVEYTFHIPVPLITPPGPRPVRTLRSKHEVVKYIEKWGLGNPGEEQGGAESEVEDQQYRFQDEHQDEYQDEYQVGENEIGYEEDDDVVCVCGRRFLTGGGRGSHYKFCETYKNQEQKRQILYNREREEQETKAAAKRYLAQRSERAPTSEGNDDVEAPTTSPTAAPAGDEGRAEEVEVEVVKDEDEEEQGPLITSYVQYVSVRGAGRHAKIVGPEWTRYKARHADKVRQCSQTTAYSTT